MNNDEYFEEKEVSFEELASIIGIDDLNTPEIYEIEDLGYEVLSTDPKTGEDVWQPIQNFVVKSNQDVHYDLNGLKGTAAHRVLYKGKWTKLSTHPDAKLVEEPISVVDLTVKNTNTYQCGGQVNHNTTTPGGMAIPCASSVRIKIESTGQKQIQDKKGNPVGIHVKAKTIKNKIANPFRKCEFQIHFGIGIREHEEVFDLFRSHCAALPKDSLGVVCNNKEAVMVEGTGAWKTFTIINVETGEVIKQEKFHKSKFDQVLYNPEYSKHVQALYKQSLTAVHESINTDSYEEAVAAKSSNK